VLSTDERNRLSKMTEAEVQRTASWKCGEAKALLLLAYNLMLEVERWHSLRAIEAARAAVQRAAASMSDACDWSAAKGTPAKARAWVTVANATLGQHLLVEGEVGELLRIEQGFLCVVMRDDRLVRTDLAEPAPAAPSP
jgi:hypothetical protein